MGPSLRGPTVERRTKRAYQLIDVDARIKRRRTIDQLKPIDGQRPSGGRDEDRIMGNPKSKQGQQEGQKSEQEEEESEGDGGHYEMDHQQTRDVPTSTWSGGRATSRKTTAGTREGF